MEYTTTQNSNWQFNPLSLYITTFIIHVQNCKLIISCTTLSFSLSQKTHLLIQFLSKKSETNNYLFYLIHCQYPENLVFRFNCDKSTFESRALCVFVSEREREREREREMENPRMLSLFLCFGFLGLCHAIESPQYTVVHSESDFEIRLYRQSMWMSAPAKDISFEKATKFGFHRYYYFLLKPCWFWVILGIPFSLFDEKMKENKTGIKVKFWVSFSVLYFGV